MYFDGNPITMTASPKPGFKFTYWEWTGESQLVAPHTDPVLRINPDTTIIATAHFEPLEPVLNIYPNPFYDEVTIYYELPEAGVATLVMPKMPLRSEPYLLISVVACEKDSALSSCASTVSRSFSLGWHLAA